MFFFPMEEQVYFLIFQLLSEATQTGISGQDSDIFEPRPCKSPTHLTLTPHQCVVYYLQPKEEGYGGQLDWVLCGR